VANNNSLRNHAKALSRKVPKAYLSALRGFARDLNFPTFKVQVYTSLTPS